VNIYDTIYDRCHAFERLGVRPFVVVVGLVALRHLEVDSAPYMLHDYAVETSRPTTVERTLAMPGGSIPVIVDPYADPEFVRVLPASAPYGVDLRREVPQ